MRKWLPTQWFGGTSGECTLGNHMTEPTETKSISSWCKRWWDSVRKCRCCPSADADSDNTLVGLKLGIKLHKLPKRTACTRYDFSELDRYKLELQNRFEALSTPESNDPDNLVSLMYVKAVSTDTDKINRKWGNSEASDSRIRLRS